MGCHIIGKYPDGALYHSDRAIGVTTCPVSIHLAKAPNEPWNEASIRTSAGQGSEISSDCWEAEYAWAALAGALVRQILSDPR